MRVLILAIFLSMICLSVSQQFKPLNQTVSGPLSRLFSWFRRPGKQPELNALSSNILTKEDFDTQLPLQSSDKAINDAISDHLISESREQQVIAGTPFIDSNQKNENDDKLVSESLTNVQSSVNSRQGYGKSAQPPSELLPLNEALRIVNTSNLGDCIARVICELSCNANAYGDPGRIVFRNLIKLQFDQTIKPEDAKFFRQAAAKGRQIVQAKKECSECFVIFPSCSTSSKDLVAVSSMFKL